MKKTATTILIVDDEAALLRLMGTFLERQGWHVAAFEDAAHALEYVEADPAHVDAALIDLTMPGLDPLELAARLLTLNQRVHVVMASGYPAGLASLQAVGAGRVSFLHKPFSPEMLLKQVTCMLAEPR